MAEASIRRIRILGFGDKLLVLNSWSYMTVVMYANVVHFDVLILPRTEKPRRAALDFSQGTIFQQVFACLPRNGQVWIAHY